MSIPLLFLALALPAVASDHSPPPVIPATSFPAVEIHNKEQLAIAVEPYDTKEKQAIFHVDYTKYGVIPVRLIITNMGDRPISLKDARILFETASGVRIQAAEPADVERLMNPHEPHNAMPVPSPLPRIPGVHRNPVGKKDKNVEADFNTFEYQALVVEPHTTRAGFLFYVVGEDPNPLRGADLYLHELRNADGQELFPFQIPFDKTVKAPAIGITTSQTN